MRLRECGLTKLETRRLGGDLGGGQIEMYKILRKYVFSIKEDSIIGQKFHQQWNNVDYHTRVDILKFSFSQRTINEWNTLSADCV